MEEITFTGDNYKKFIEECVKLKTEKIQTAVTNIDILPLKDNSVYVVEFAEGAKPDFLNTYMQFLTERVKDHGITFVASCPIARIKGIKGEE